MGIGFPNKNIKPIILDLLQRFTNERAEIGKIYFDLSSTEIVGEPEQIICNRYEADIIMYAYSIFKRHYIEKFGKPDLKTGKYQKDNTCSIYPMPHTNWSRMNID
jgi:hypothetical protein